MTSISTKRLILAPWGGSLADANKHVEWLNDIEIVRYSEQRHKIHNLRMQLDYLESIQPPNLYRQIIHEGKLIGSITAYVDIYNKIADMGILIGDKTKWGQGFGTEAWIALMQHLLNTGVRKVEAGCMELNQPMIHIFQNSGMRFEGCREHHFLCDGEPWALEQWARFND